MIIIIRKMMNSENITLVCLFMTSATTRLRKSLATAVSTMLSAISLFVGNPEIRFWRLVQGLNQASRPCPVSVIFVVSTILSAISLFVEVPETSFCREVQGLSKGEADVLKSSKRERRTTLMLNVKEVNGRYLT